MQTGIALTALMQRVSPSGGAALRNRATPVAIRGPGRTIGGHGEGLRAGSAVMRVSRGNRAGGPARGNQEDAPGVVSQPIAPLVEQDGGSFDELLEVGIRHRVQVEVHDTPILRIDQPEPARNVQENSRPRRRCAPSASAETGGLPARSRTERRQAANNALHIPRATAPRRDSRVPAVRAGPGGAVPVALGD